VPGKNLADHAIKKRERERVARELPWSLKAESAIGVKCEPSAEWVMEMCDRGEGKKNENAEGPMKVTEFNGRVADPVKTNEVEYELRDPTGNEDLARVLGMSPPEDEEGS
jgi:hypothetical protein